MQPPDDEPDERRRDSRGRPIGAPVRRVDHRKLLWGERSWADVDGRDFVSASEMEAAVLLERETDAVELWLREAVYRDWVAFKATLAGAAAPPDEVSVPVPAFVAALRSFARACRIAGAEAEIQTLANLAISRSSGDGIVFAPLFEAIDTNGASESQVWGRDELTWLRSLVTTKQEVLLFHLRNALDSGDHGVDAYGAMLPDGSFWGVLEDNDLAVPLPFRRALCARYGSAKGGCVRVDSFKTALRVPASATDVYLCKRRLGSLLHRRARELRREAGSLVFPPPSLVRRAKLAISTRPRGRCGRPSAAWHAAGGAADAVRGDYLLSPDAFGCSLRAEEDESHQGLLQACVSASQALAAPPDHLPAAEFARVAAAFSPGGVPVYPVLVLSVVYNDTAVPALVNFRALLTDLYVSEVPCGDCAPGSYAEESALARDGTECSEALVLMYRKWCNKGKPSLLEDGAAGDVPCGEFQSVVRRKLGLLLEPPLLAVVCWHFSAAASPEALPRALAFSAAGPPGTTQELRARIREPPPLIVSLAGCQQCLQCMDSIVA
ncbi:hypothetical protein DIPPA_11117 [Diplonema papillatum]|nr:hypothetical protein DIPPA_11117 [Diplonema papillatum]